MSYYYDYNWLKLWVTWGWGVDYIYIYGFGLSMGCIQVISHIQAVGNVSWSACCWLFSQWCFSVGSPQLVQSCSIYPLVICYSWLLKMVELPIKKCDFPCQNVSLPEGIYQKSVREIRVLFTNLAISIAMGHHLVCPIEKIPSKSILPILFPSISLLNRYNPRYTCFFAWNLWRASNVLSI